MNLDLRHLKLTLAQLDCAFDVAVETPGLALFGPSGSGKTTLLELVAGLRRPEGGSLRWNGCLWSDAATRHHVDPRLRRLGYVPQDGALFPHLSVVQNLSYGVRADAKAAPRVSDEIVEALEIGPLFERAVHRLSGGEKQRVALARALFSAPRLLLLDEPFTALDDARRARAIALLQRRRATDDLSWIMVSHRLDELAPLCPWHLRVMHGRIVASGPTGDLDPALLPQPELLTR